MIIRNKTLIIMSFVLAFGLYFSSSKVSKALKFFHKYDQYVEVKGFDERIVNANQGSWRIAFNTSADDLVKLYKDVSDTQKTVTRFLTDAGFKESEIEIIPVTVVDNKSDSYAQNNASVARYKAFSGITLVTNNVNLAAKTSQKTILLLQQGVLITSSIVNYSYTNLNEIKADMLKAATQNARDSAKSFSKVAKTDLGSIRRAHQGLFTITPAGGASEYDDSTIMKKVRVVTTVQFYLK